ncbi:MAG: GDSL-type esterase/lipase family protein [Burkholderiaceae bacterium]|jgi:lysophospholipase L1-like esterase|nr:GDSL-type esterase/lipase family protein [Burkholderiaceae bacterium]
MRRRVLLASALALTGVAAGAVARPCLELRSRVQTARAMNRSGEAYEQLGNRSEAVLVVGDSTARGAGADTPQQSLAGRIGAALPDARLINRGRDGACFADVIEQLRSAPALPYRFVLISAGANDVLQMTAPAQARRDAEQALALAQRLAEDVVLMTVPNVGHAPLLPWPFNRFYSQRARAVFERLRGLGERPGVSLVRLFFDRSTDPFARDPARYLAADGLHPSSAGYALWFDALRRTAPHLI